MMKTQAEVESITPLSNSIIQLLLRPENYIDYFAGQYLQIFTTEFLSYSIANAPLGANRYELHIRHEKNPYQQPLFAQIKKDRKLILHLPLGDCYLEKFLPERPIMFIAGGTGFAPIKAMIEQLLATGDKRPFELFWGARSQSDLYMDEKVRAWQTHVSHFQYYSFLPKKQARLNLADEVALRHPQNLQEFQFVIAGPFEMVYDIRDTLVALGINTEYIFSDAFSFEQQEK